MPTKNSDKTDTPPVANERPALRQQADAVRQKLAEQGINAEDISAAVAWAQTNKGDKHGSFEEFKAYTLEVVRGIRKTNSTQPKVWTEPNKT